MGILPNHEKAAAFSLERAATVRAELAAILRSSSFSGSKRCQDFLEFIVNQALDGNYDYLTERFLGAELFGRPIDYETGTDSIVRVRAIDVRRRLAQYYSEEHGDSQVSIDLVSGTYVPDFHWLEQKAAEPAHGDSSLHEQSVTPPKTAVSISGEAAYKSRGTPRRWSILAALVVIGTLGACVGYLWLKARDLNRSLYPLKYQPSMSALWAEFFDSSRETDIVLSDASFQLLQDIGKRKFTLNDYINRSYMSQLQAQNSNPEMRAALTQIASKNFGNSSEFRLAQRILALDSLENRVHIYNSRDYSSPLAAQDNLVLIGSQYTNPWQQLFANQLNFIENPPGNSPGAIINSAPRPGEHPTYIPSDAVGYCVVAYLPRSDHNTKALLIEGSSSEATEAGGDFLLSEDQLANFEKMLHSDNLPFFEVLLKTSQVRGTPITATIEAYRIYSSQP